MAKLSKMPKKKSKGIRFAHLHREKQRQKSGKLNDPQGNQSCYIHSHFVKKSSQSTLTLFAKVA